MSDFPTATDADWAWAARKEAETMDRLAKVIRAAMDRGYDPDTPLFLDRTQDWSALRHYALNEKGWVLNDTMLTIQAKPKKSVK